MYPKFIEPVKNVSILLCPLTLNTNNSEQKIVVKINLFINLGFYNTTKNKFLVIKNSLFSPILYNKQKSSSFLLIERKSFCLKEEILLFS